MKHETHQILTSQIDEAWNTPDFNITDRWNMEHTRF